jgi:hypothetical protein
VVDASAACRGLGQAVLGEDLKRSELGRLSGPGGSLRLPSFTADEKSETCFALRPAAVKSDTCVAFAAVLGHA